LEQVPSASEAERVMKQGGFEIDGLPVGDPTSRLNLEQPGSYRVRFGKKKFLRVVVE
jgi:tyrosyl-tRNA synthetase